MPFSASNAAHVSQIINETATAITKLQELRLQLNQYVEIDQSNNASSVLGAASAFPTGFNLTPARVNDARFALNVIKEALDAAITSGVQNSLDIFLFDIGRVVGTG